MAASLDVGTDETTKTDVDVVVVGAGFAGLYLLHRLRQMGFDATVLESAADVGGTWYWNRYPGARCDIESIDYSYSFDPELETDWQWSEKYATQPEILQYINHVADRYDLRRDIQFNTKVDHATWDHDRSQWKVATSNGSTTTCRFYVMATGCLSVPKDLDIKGAARFAGESYFTNKWPHEPVEFAGKRVGVIGTGSSGVQAIPLIAEQASQLTVFQRTPNFSMPAHNGPVTAAKQEAFNADRDTYRHNARRSRAGVPMEPATEGALSVSADERQARYEAVWATGSLLGPGGTFNDLMINEASNDTIAEFIRNKIRSVVDDPQTAELLCPYDHPYGTKRPCLDTNYYQTYNQPHVSLVDLGATPIDTITETGIQTTDDQYELDVIVFATGFDAMTGAIVAVDITGRDGLSLADKWADGPSTYLGVTVNGFPNLFTVTGPGSPSVLSNMMVSIEQHVEWITDTIKYLTDNGFTTIEATPTAETAWVQHNNDTGAITLLPKTKSWYMGANVPGKPQVFLPYIGGVDAYRATCDEVVERGYLGFELAGGGHHQLNDGIIRSLQPDVAALLDMMIELDLPPLESMTAQEARQFSVAMAAQRPSGPEVSEIVDGTYPAGDGEMAYRMYRPHQDGPRPIIAYFHGGGWVLGSAESDDPFCRDLCVRTGAIVISLDYRHAPEHRFPAAADDAIAALGWVAENAEALGAIPGQIAVCGWSAGGNLATVAAMAARDGDGPEICGQVLVTPVTDWAMDRPSMSDNAEGYVLTRSLMEWFWDHYAEPADRRDPKASPLRAADLSNMPPTLVVAAEFDPLRDEGVAYAEALADAGVDARSVVQRGHIHTSLTAVDVIISGATVRAEIAQQFKQMFSRQ